MSVRVTLNCQVKADQFELLYPFLEINLPNVRGFQGNRRVSVLYDTNSDEMLLDEEWLSVESHQAYLQHIAENGVLAKLAEFLLSPPQIKYFEQLDV
ncbi:antibiotic biosynthesis monooxygenase [Enterovibrio sp. ZSDZ42]|uniref:Antibiotic biosynthesis monooxygenase n=1 Tax=Enterovibrio gelatinilyticus TaxID=2899819 RepID=A0ABT5R650_9GAMM|nr:antibiotic biosynthesis monooxygenase [Enterovibrio sp. ZSDZ42]MDD1795464.1 antibiotic biosynthesis monooxygenase [Enterovibrio sp. ZSDZ42]